MLTCATCGSRLTGPLRLLPEPPPRPEFDGTGADETGFLPGAVRVIAV